VEVHHHPELPHGEKKRFKEYLLEFIMIFLAVTMGFIAENIREHLSDSSKENEYITGMVKNLEVDTIRLNKVINENRKQADGIDSLRKVSKDKLSQLIVQDSLYLYTSKYLWYTNDFTNDDITLTQLRNAGGYRLIKNNGVLDSIAEYESRMRDINDEYNGFASSLEKARDDANAIFDLNIGHNFRLHPNSTQVLITTDKERIYKYYNGCWYALLGLSGYDQMLENHLKYSTRLISYLKKEYDIE